MNQKELMKLKKFLLILIILNLYNRRFIVMNVQKEFLKLQFTQKTHKYAEHGLNKVFNLLKAKNITQEEILRSIYLANEYPRPEGSGFTVAFDKISCIKIIIVI